MVRGLDRIAPRTGTWARLVGRGNCGARCHRARQAAWRSSTRRHNGGGCRAECDLPLGVHRPISLLSSTGSRRISRTVINRVYSKLDFDRLYPFHGGSTISGGGGARWILCELLVHGYDIAAATGNSGGYRPREASIAIRGPAESMDRLVESKTFADIVSIWETTTPSNSSHPRDPCPPVTSLSTRNPTSCSWLYSEGLNPPIRVGGGCR